MEWEREAEEYLKKVPFFVRKKVKKEIEKFLQDKGYKRVTLEGVFLAKEALLEKMSQAEKGFEVSGCFGLNSCPNALTTSEELLKKLEKILKEEQITEFLKEKVKGPLKAHHQFKVLLSECPNACSQIYIADFALHGVVKISVNPKACSFCRSCVEVCEEEAITISDFGPVVDEEKCVGCGSCLKVCPEEALQEDFRGYKIYIGGKLGRHPRLATFLTYASPEEVLTIFKKVISFYKKYNTQGERLGTLLERVGWEKAKEMVS